jgi:short chain dehydrogenase
MPAWQEGPGATKFGLAGLTRALAAEGAPHAIRVVCLYPGAMATHWGTWDAADRNQPSRATPEDALPPEDAAGYIAWLACAPAPSARHRGRDRPDPRTRLAMTQPSPPRRRSPATKRKCQLAGELAGYAGNIRSVWFERTRVTGAGVGRWVAGPVRAWLAAVSGLRAAGRAAGGASPAGRRRAGRSPHPRRRSTR